MTGKIHKMSLIVRYHQWKPLTKKASLMITYKAKMLVLSHQEKKKIKATMFKVKMTYSIKSTIKNYNKIVIVKTG